MKYQAMWPIDTLSSGVQMQKIKQHRQQFFDKIALRQSEKQPTGSGRQNKD
jgi:hypothetical protein